MIIRAVFRMACFVAFSVLYRCIWEKNRDVMTYSWRETSILNLDLSFTFLKLYIALPERNS